MKGTKSKVLCLNCIYWPAKISLSTSHSRVILLHQRGNILISACMHFFLFLAFLSVFLSFFLLLFWSGFLFWRVGSAPGSHSGCSQNPGTSRQPWQCAHSHLINAASLTGLVVKRHIWLFSFLYTRAAGYQSWFCSFCTFWSYTFLFFAVFMCSRVPSCLTTGFWFCFFPVRDGLQL